MARLTVNSSLTAEQLRNTVVYDPETGLFTWRYTRTKFVANMKAGSLHHTGYFSIMVLGHRHLSHRLAWLYMTGEWPAADIDHIDRNPANNAWINLRQATHADNMHNASKQRNNTSGFKGVFRKRHKWGAKIGLAGRIVHLGNFHTKEEAYAAYCKAAKQLHGEFARVT